MVPKPVTSRWLRGLRRLTLVLIGVPVAGGLAYECWSAWRGDVLAAVVGAAVTLAILAGGLLCLAWLRVGMALLRGQRRIERLERRVEAQGDAHGSHEQLIIALKADVGQQRQCLEQQARQLAEAAEHSRERDRRAEQRIAGLQARIEAFCNLHEDQAEGLEHRVARLEAAARRAAEPADAVRISDAHWAVEDTPPGERTVSAFRHLVGQDGAGDGAGGAGPGPAARKRRMAQEFASLIHRRDYVGALAKGDQIADEFPDSTAAVDFRRVRPHLVRKIELVASASPDGGG